MISYKFFGSSEVYKISKAMNIVDRYPEHQFILIGDSGEKDPEIYARIYREYPHNIKQILIRAVEGSNLHTSRFEEVFRDVPKSKWKVFSEPSHSLLEDWIVKKPAIQQNKQLILSLSCLV